MATVEQVHELKTKMAEERAKLVEAASALDQQDALRVPVDAEGEEQWTALEQLSHLWEMERNYDAWVLKALRETSPDLAGVTGGPVAVPVEVANEATVDELLYHLEVERAYTLGIIDTIPLDGFDRTARSPIFGELTVLQWLRSFYRHDRQHTAQVLGRKSDYTPQFAGGKEPDQRTPRLARARARQR